MAEIVEVSGVFYEVVVNEGGGSSQIIDVEPPIQTVEILEVAKQGPAGPPGANGTDGTNGTTDLTNLILDCGNF